MRHNVCAYDAVELPLYSEPQHSYDAAAIDLTTLPPKKHTKEKETRDGDRVHFRWKSFNGVVAQSVQNAALLSLGFRC